MKKLAAAVAISAAMFTSALLTAPVASAAKSGSCNFIYSAYLERTFVQNSGADAPICQTVQARLDKYINSLPKTYLGATGSTSSDTGVIGGGTHIHNYGRGTYNGALGGWTQIG